MLRPLALLLVVTAAATGCTPLAVQHQADAAFRQAITAHVRHDEPAAERYYHEIIALGFDWSAVWNNLAVIEAHRHHYIAARKLLARAVAVGPREVIPLTNYGVVSYWLADLKESRRALDEAQWLRDDNLNHIPSIGDNHYQHDHYAKVTERLVAVAQKYLRKIDQSELGRAAPAPLADGQRVADLHDLSGVGGLTLKRPL